MTTLLMITGLMAFVFEVSVIALYVSYLITRKDWDFLLI